MVEARYVVSNCDVKGFAIRCHCKRDYRRRLHMQNADLVAHNKMCVTVAR